MEQTKLLEGEKPDFKKTGNDTKAIQIQRPKEPSELQQAYVRKLLINIQTIIDDFAKSQQKSISQEKEEKRIDADIEKAQRNIVRPPEVDSPEYIKWKKLRWEQTILLACNCYYKMLNQFQSDNKEFVKTLEIFQREMKRVLNRLVAVQPLPESMKNRIKEEKRIV